MNRHNRERRQEISKAALETGVALYHVAQLLQEQGGDHSGKSRPGCTSIQLTAEIGEPEKMTTVFSRIRPPEQYSGVAEKVVSRWRALRKSLGSTGVVGYTLRAGISKRNYSIPEKEVITTDKGKLICEAPKKRHFYKYHRSNSDIEKWSTDTAEDSNTKLLETYTEVVQRALARAGVTDATEFNKLPDGDRRAIVVESGVTMAKLTAPITGRDQERRDQELFQFTASR